MRLAEIAFSKAKNAILPEVPVEDIDRMMQSKNRCGFSVANHDVYSDIFGKKVVYIMFSDDKNILMTLILVPKNDRYAIEGVLNNGGKGWTSELLAQLCMNGLKLVIDNSTPLTVYGKNSLLRAIRQKSIHKIPITTDTGEPVDLQKVKTEWEDAKNSGRPGSTTIFVG